MDIKLIGKRILDARKVKDLTQMALADEMMVSYQAVSNWERGLTMPDISKIPQLCEILNLSIEDLLGKVSLNPLVQRSMNPNQKINQATVQDIESVGPIIPTQEVDEALNILKETCTLEDIILIAPFASIETLDALVDKAIKNTSISSRKVTGLLGDLAPFISGQKIDDLVEGMDFEEHEATLSSLLPFLSDASLERLLNRCLDSEHEDYAINLAPFLSKSQLDGLAQIYYQKGGAEKFACLAPFLSDKVLNAYALTILKEQGLKGYQALLPFINTKEIDRILKTCLNEYI